MKATFTGAVDANIEIEQNSLVINDRTISLRAAEALSPSMMRVLEELAKPEANGGVFRVEREGTEVRLTKIGVMGHAMHKLGRRA